MAAIRPPSSPERHRVISSCRRAFHATPHLSLDHLGADVGLDDVALAHIANAEHKTRLAVSLADYGVARKEKGLRALFRPRQLREHDADHERLQDHARHRLDAQSEDRLRAFVRRVFRPVPTSALS